MCVFECEEGKSEGGVRGGTKRRDGVSVEGCTFVRGMGERIGMGDRGGERGL